MRGSYVHLISNTALHITFLSSVNCVSIFLDREEQAKVIANEDKSDENMWVPSDLDSQSEIKEDENGTKMEEDAGNSDGESSSEGDLP